MSSEMLEKVLVPTILQWETTHSGPSSVARNCTSVHTFLDKKAIYAHNGFKKYLYEDLETSMVELTLFFKKKSRITHTIM